MAQKLFECCKCHKRFGSERAVTDHSRDAHASDEGFIKHKPMRREHREPTIADRMIAAELAIACGEKTEDVWLLP